MKVDFITFQERKKYIVTLSPAFLTGNLSDSLLALSKGRRYLNPDDYGQLPHDWKMLEEQEPIQDLISASVANSMAVAMGQAEVLHPWDFPSFCEIQRLWWKADSTVSISGKATAVCSSPSSCSAPGSDFGWEARAGAPAAF